MSQNSPTKNIDKFLKGNQAAINRLEKLKQKIKPQKTLHNTLPKFSTEKEASNARRASMERRSLSPSKAVGLKHRSTFDEESMSHEERTLDLAEKSPMHIQGLQQMTQQNRQARYNRLQNGLE